MRAQVAAVQSLGILDRLQNEPTANFRSDRRYNILLVLIYICRISLYISLACVENLLKNMNAALYFVQFTVLIINIITSWYEIL